MIGTHHARLAMPQLDGLCDYVFRQPASRDTGMALYVALAMIKRWTPNAVVTITPTDHYVAPSARYVAQVRQAREVAAKLRDRAVVLGATPREPDPELGYLALGDALSEIPSVHRVRGFVEKPDASVASALIAGGALWNTMVTCGTVDALWELGREAEPQLLDILDSLVPLIGTQDEDDAIDYVYRAYLPVSFSHDILERVPGRLAAIEMFGIEWSDWASPSASSRCSRCVARGPTSRDWRCNEWRPRSGLAVLSPRRVLRWSGTNFALFSGWPSGRAVPVRRAGGEEPGPLACGTASCAMLSALCRARASIRLSRLRSVDLGRRGRAATRTSCCSIPYAKRITGGLDWDESLFGYRSATPASDPKTDTAAAHICKVVVVNPYFDWGNDRPRETPCTRRSSTRRTSRASRSATRTSRGTARHVRGARHPGDHRATCTRSA